MRRATNEPHRCPDILATASQSMRVPRGAVVAIALGLALLSSVVAPAAAQTTIDWNNAAGGDYDDTSNWNPMNVPDNSPGPENARFALPAAYDVTFNSGSNITVNDLLVEDGSVTFAADGAPGADYIIDRFALIDAAVLTLSGAGGGANVTLTIDDLLRVRDGGTLNVFTGSDVKVNSSLSVGTDAGVGVVHVSGSGSTLVVNGTGGHLLGQFGQTGMLTFDDHSTGNSIAGTLHLASGVTADTTGILEVFDGANLTLGNLFVGPGTQTGQMASVTVGSNGGDPAQILQTGASTLSIGSTGDGIATLTVESGGTFDSGTGQITVNPSGTIHVQDGAQFAARGNVLLDGGTLRVDDPSDTDLDEDFQFDGLMLTAQNSARVNFNDSYTLRDGTTFHIIDGAVMTSSHLTVGTGGSDGALVVDGSTGESILSVNGELNVGTVGGSSAVTVRAGATASIGTFLTVTGGLGFAGGTFDVQGGATVTAFSILVGTDRQSAGGNGSITVGTAGTSSNLILTGSTMTVGHRTVGAGTLTINSGGTFNAGSGTVIIRKKGLVHIQNGRFETDGDILVDGGILRLRGGVFSWGNGRTMTVSDGGELDFLEFLEVPASATINLNGGQINTDSTLLLGADATFNMNGGSVAADVGLVLHAGATFNMNGGSVDVASITFQPASTLNFNAGTLRFTDDLTLSADDAFSDIQHVTHGRTLIVENQTTLSGGVLTIDGGTFSTGSLVNSQSLDFRRGTFELTGDDLTVGSGGLLGPTVVLPFGKDVNVTNAVSVTAVGRVSLQGGRLSGGTINNAGHIDMAGASSTLGGGTIINSGLIGGDGEITAVVNNQASGEIRVAVGEQLRLTAAGNTNDGRVSLFGGTVEFTQDLINDAGGTIAGQGSLIVGGGLTNNGAVSFGGTTNVDGNVANNPTGAITASGGGTTNFLGDLVNNGELAIGTSSFATVFGTLSGSGSITGEGTLIVEGQFNPGSSPAAVEIATDFQLGAGAVVRIELGGLSPGAQYDQVHVAGRAELDGELTVAAIDGFRPKIGDEFEIMTYASLSGTFDRVTAAPGYAWELAYGERALVIRATAVPEPATWPLVLIGIAIGGVVVRKRHGRV